MSKEFNQSINMCVNFLKDIDYLLHTVNCSSLIASDNFRKASTRALNYREIYDVGIANQDFNFVMDDKSFFQFHEKSENTELRLAFYPNPYNSIATKKFIDDAQDLFDSGEISLAEYEQYISEENILSDMPLIRYDLSFKQYCDRYHPTAHFHIGFHSENRWPVKRILTPYCFMLNILSLYYQYLWKKHGDQGEGLPNRLDLLYRVEVQKCQALDATKFKAHESERLHFG